jgi:monoamine oxidase
MIYEKALWKSAGFSGQLVSDDASEPIQWAVDHSTEDDKFCALIGFINGRRVVTWRDMSKEDRKRAICEQYTRFFGISELLHPRDYMECDWASEPFSRGSSRFVSDIFPVSSSEGWHLQVVMSA